ncbi:peptidoglycan DD-metalloendopeptidase family protein [Mycetocola sp.]|uniref:peptidoglycan DD-metalloendopeptidase family protein n=1 Tax=Mycetocola sp. TaxID=1871042 RepID=UPI0026350E9A|nr:peptidoglycan DD-metalloendopeptidase family protein [Mycetocola sp.]MCU1561414.1 Murein DD-endopeptidase MepM and murein hydrolase activator NlpD, containing LysM domain [Mycetocola sp.]
MSDESSREPDNGSGGESALDLTTALPTRRSLRAAARSASSTGAPAEGSTVVAVEQSADSETAEPIETDDHEEPADAAQPVVMVDVEPVVDPVTAAVPTISMPPVPSRARLAARMAATPAPASVRTVPKQSRWKSIRSLLVVAIAVPSIFGTVALPAYAFTSEDAVSVAPIHDTGAQSLTVPTWTRPALVRDGYSATSAEELRAAEAAKAAAAAAAEAAKLAASRPKSGENTADYPVFTGGDGTWIRPVAGPISSPYGPRGLICNGAGCSNSFHDGVDFSASCGTPVKAVSAGRVTFTGSAGAYGQRVIVDHGGGVESIYGHVQSGSFKVSSGQLVEPGTVVANVGATGVVSGCHLDLKIRINGDFTNPVPFMAAKGVKL